MKVLRCQLLIILTIIMSLILISCSSEGGNMILVEQNVDMLSLAKITHKYSKVVEALNLNTDIDNLDDLLGKQSYKKNEWGYYTIVNTDEGLLMICFNSEKIYIGCMNITFSDDLIRADIADLSVGMSLDKVKTLDPKGSYPFLYSGWGGYPKVSYHYFRNGTVYIIQYDELGFISGTSSFVL